MSEITVKHELDPHCTGGKFKELFKFDSLSSIMYMLNKNEFTVFHKLKDNDEIWYLIEGCPIIIHTFIKGEYKKFILNEFNNEYRILKNTYFAVENMEKDSYSLSVCLIKPSMDWDKMIIPKRSEMLSLFPEQKELITRLTSN
ncbi:MAG: cupin domain-containing protein [Clostridia bacterium]|nr:cupin domain-containing protein [Clostridia bacterium]